MIRKETLDNGLTLISERMPHVRSVTIGVWLRQGSRNESAKLNGISHFIEHLVFKGTETRSAREIALSMDSIGGQIDAFTSKEYTCFYAKVLDEHVEEALDLLADIVQHPRFDPEEIERERQVVLEEIRMVEDSPDDLIFDLFSDKFYPGNMLGRPIQGTTKSVSGLSRSQLLRFFRRAYRPGNMLVAAAGNVRHDRLVRWVRNAFGSLPAGASTNGSKSRPRAHRCLVKRAKPLAQLHLLMGLPAFRESARDRYALYILNTVLGGTMSSRLFQKIREERGLAYSVYSALNGYADSGFLVVYAATRPDGGREVIRLTLAELRDLRDQGPSRVEVGVAKEHLKGQLMLSLESTSSRMSNLARQELFLKKHLSLEETLQRVDRVTAGQVHRLAREIVGHQKLALAVVGPIKKLHLGREDLRP